jgi:putative Holliday junction resolvase
MRVLGVDFGLRHVGLAISDETGSIARPLRTLRLAGVREAPDAVAAVARQEEAGRVIVGVPEGLEGEEGRPETRRVLRFAKALRANTGLRVDLQDESLSSREAGPRSGRRARTDGGLEHARAAAVVLQRWLDEHPQARAGAGPSPEGDA